MVTVSIADALILLFPLVLAWFGKARGVPILIFIAGVIWVLLGMITLEFPLNLPFMGLGVFMLFWGALNGN